MAESKTGKKFMRRKSKTNQSVSPSVGDDGSQLSKSSKKSFMGKLMKRKSVKGKAGGTNSKREVSQSENDNSVVPDSSSGKKETDVQKAFLKNGGQDEKKPYMLKIALLLVDAKTRRFELLQLEFDSDKALVSDALSQIPIHVTEKVLSSQTYSGVCGATGTERKKNVPLFQFCKGNDVLVAIPSGTSADECARLAKPILSDEKVIGMLSTSGINADPWTTAPLAAPRATSSSSRSRQAPRAKETEKKSGMGSILLYVLLGVAVVAALAYIYRLKSASSDPESPSVPGASWSAPKVPKVDLDPVWSTCHAACDSYKEFTEKYIVSPASKEA